MKVYLGPYTPHWSTRNIEDLYLEKMHKVEYAFQVEEENSRTENYSQIRYH